MDKKCHIGSLVLGLGVGGMVMWIVAALIANGAHGRNRQQAIDANVAEWRVDAMTGAREFVYIKCECEELPDAE